MPLPAYVVFVGLAAGAGQTVTDDVGVHPSVQVDRHQASVVGQAFVGLRVPAWQVAIEAGLLELPDYYCRAQVADYPSYKGIPAGSYPQSADITQQISARAGYLRLNVYGPQLWRVTPYGFAGRAWVRSHNIESGAYNGTDPAYFEIGLSKTALYVGGGLELRLAERWSARAEVGVLPAATESYWTGTRDITIGTVGVVYAF